jgi:hypothetical protein
LTEERNAWERFKEGWRGTQDPEAIRAAREDEQRRMEERRAQREVRAAQHQAQREEQAAAAEAERQRIKTPEERSAVMEKAIARYVRKGYAVQARTEYDAHLYKHKRFSWPLGVLWILLGFVTFGLTWLLFVLQVLEYAFKANRAVHLSVDPTGELHGGSWWH